MIGAAVQGGELLVLELEPADEELSVLPVAVDAEDLPFLKMER
jgi:hypothetical protein